MRNDSELVKLYKSIENIQNAALNVRSDIKSERKRMLLSDFSILFGTIYPHKAFYSSNELLSAAKASSATTKIYEELGENSPVDLVIPPATVAEIISSLQRESEDYKNSANNKDGILRISSLRDRVDTLGTEEIAAIIRQIPNGHHDKGIKNVVSLFSSPNFKSCSELFGKDCVIESHRRSKRLRTSLMQVFTQYRHLTRPL